MQFSEQSKPNDSKQQLNKVKEEVNINYMESYRSHRTVFSVSRQEG